MEKLQIDPVVVEVCLSFLLMLAKLWVYASRRRKYSLFYSTIVFLGLAIATLHSATSFALLAAIIDTLYPRQDE